jgi:hypothetical protein
MIIPSAIALLAVHSALCLQFFPISSGYGFCRKDTGPGMGTFDGWRRYEEASITYHCISTLEIDLLAIRGAVWPEIRVKAIFRDLL